MPRLLQLAAAFLMGALGVLEATTLEQLSMDEMIQKSTGIVRAKVVSSYAAVRGGDVYTYYRLEVTESWKGPRPAEVAVPGGVLKGVRQSIAGVPYLTPGEDYLLFLWTGKSGLTQVIGMSQGVFGVKVDASGNPVVTRAASMASMVDHDDRPVKDNGVSLRLSELRTRVKSALASQEVQ